MGYYKDTERKVYIVHFYPYIHITMTTLSYMYTNLLLYGSTELHVTVSVSNQANIKLSNKYEA